MINVQTKDFRAAASLAGMVVERRNTIPILSALRCRANGRLDVAGTDLDMTLEASVPREGADEATFTIGDHAFISKALAASGEERASLSLSDGKLSVEAGALSILCKFMLPVEDWPADCGVVAEETFSATLSPEHLRQIGRAVFAMSQEETRYYLNGVYLHHVGGWDYRAVATDGHRLAIVELSLPDAAGALDGVIIPKKAVSILLRAFGKSTDPVRFSGGFGLRVNRETSTAPERVGNPRVAFAGKARGADVCISTKTIDGTFPDYRRVVPTDQPISAVFALEDLRRAVKAVSRGEERARAVKLDFGKSGVTITSRFVETSTEAGIVVPCEHNAPADFSIGFNGRYLLDMLGAIHGGEVALALIDYASPTVFRDPADTAFTGVLMPMRV